MMGPTQPEVPVFGKSPYTETRVLIVVKTYPNPSQKYLETVCTAGITDDGKLIRLYPIPFRRLAGDQQFRKYQWVRVGLKKSVADSRPESFQIDETSLRPDGRIDTRDGWLQRRDLVLPLRSRSLEELRERREASGCSLGIIRPRAVKRFKIAPAADPGWSEEELAKLRRAPLFAGSPAYLLEKVPWEFRYEFECDDPACKGHDMQVFDWEVLQSFRKWRSAYPRDWQKKMEETYWERMVNRRDLHFFFGTVAGHPQSWTIIGLFYPPSETPASVAARTNRKLEVTRRPGTSAPKGASYHRPVAQASLLLETE